MQGFLEETGVFHGQYRLMMEISHNPNASQAESKLMRVSPATIAVSLKKLENNGYINREIDEADNRLKKITISEKGNQVVMQSRQIFESTDTKVFANFTEQEKSTLSQLLKKLDANLVKMENDINLEKERL